MRLGRSRTHTRTHTQTVDCVQFGGPAPPVDSFFGFAHAFAKARQLAQARPFLSTVRSTARAFLFKMSSWVGPGNVTVFDAVYRPSISSSPRRKPVSSIFQDRRLHMDLLDRAPQGHPGKGSPVNSIFQVLNIVRSRNIKSKTHTQHTHTHIHTYTHTHTHIHTHTHTYTHKHTRTVPHTHIHIRTHAHTQNTTLCMLSHTFKSKTHTHTHAHTHTHTHTHKGTGCPYPS